MYAAVEMTFIPAMQKSESDKFPNLTKRNCWRTDISESALASAMLVIEFPFH